MKFEQQFENLLETLRNYIVDEDHLSQDDGDGRWYVGPEDEGRMLGNAFKNAMAAYDEAQACFMDARPLPEVTMAQEERDCLDGDMFAYISDSVSRYIAEICGKLGVGRCTCSVISDIVRKKNGHPLYRDLKRIKELEGK